MKAKILLIALTILVVSCSQEVEIGNIDVKIQTVKVVHPELKSFTSTLRIIGNAKANKEVGLHAMESGVIIRIKKDIGDKVKKGDVLAVLQNPELSRQLIIHKAEMEVTQSSYLRLKSVYDKTPELTTITDFENVEATYKIAKAKYESTINRDMLLTIKAPFSGLLTQRNIEIGALVQNSLNSSSPIPLFQIMDMDIIRVIIDLPETEADNISVGMNAVISFSELAGKEFNVKVSRMANMIDNASKTMEVQIDIPNENHVIKAGMYAEVNLQLQSDGEKFSLPNESVIAVKSEFFVYKVTDGVVQKILIKKGLSNNQFFEINSDKIISSDNIIVEGKALVKDGMSVNISE